MSGLIGQLPSTPISNKKKTTMKFGSVDEELQRIVKVDQMLNMFHIPKYL